MRSRHSLFSTAWLGWVCALAVLLAPATVWAKQFRFVGLHPVAKEAGSGFCYIEVPHVHVYEPVQAEVLYRPTDGWSDFVSDPVAFGYDGPKFVFPGAHPVHADHGGPAHHCYLKGAHFHEYQPEAVPGFVVKGGVYFYVDPFPKAFYVDRPRYARINVVYQPIRYPRPAVVVEPPPQYVDVLVVEASVRAPAARAVVVAPAARVDVGGPGVSGEAHFGLGVEVRLPPPPRLRPLPPLQRRPRRPRPSPTRGTPPG